MSKRMGVREFRENFTVIARDATEPVTVTSHDKIVGWFVPAKRPPPDVVREVFEKLDEIRREVEARGVDVAGRMRELGLEDDEAFEDPWTQAHPPRGKRR